MKSLWTEVFWEMDVIQIVLEWEDFATKDWKTNAKEEVRIELGGCMMLVSGKKIYHPLEDQLADPFVQTLQYGMGKVNKS